MKNNNLRVDKVQSDAISLLFLGDYLESDCSKVPRLSSALYQVFKQHDFICTNFEGPICGAGKRIKKPGPNLCQNIHATETLKDWDVNLACLANNHIMDNGVDGLNATIEKLHVAGIDTCGAGRDLVEAFHPYTIYAGESTICILSVSENALFGMASASEPGCAWICHPHLITTIKDLSRTADLLIVCAHAGAECVPLPLPEWREKYHQLCDAGVNVIIGTHPHVPQPWEVYNNAVIFYSLGNSWFDYGKTTTSHSDGYAVSLVCSKGKLHKAQVIPLKMQNKFLDIPPLASFNDYLSTAKRVFSDEIFYEAMAACQSKYLWINSYLPLRSYIMMVSDSTEQWWISCSKVLCRIIPNIRLRQRQYAFEHLFAIESHRWAISRALTFNDVSQSDIDAFEVMLTKMGKCSVFNEQTEDYLLLDVRY